MSDSNVQRTQTVMTEVASRLRQTEQRAATVISALERQKSIQDSLNVASKGLHEANSAIAKFARETKRATEEFVETVSALRGAIDVLQQANPDALKSRLDSMDQRVRQIEREFKNLRNHIEAELTQLRGEMNAVGDRVVERLTPRSVLEGMFGRRKG